MVNKNTDTSNSDSQGPDLPDGEFEPTKKTSIKVVDYSDTDEAIENEILPESDNEVDSSVDDDTETVSDGENNDDPLANSDENTESITEVPSDVDGEKTDIETVEDAILAASLENNDESPSENSNDDSEIDALVDDIVRTESTEQIKQEDAKLSAAALPAPKPGLKNRITSAFKKWWHTIWLRNTTIGLAIVLLMAVVLIPTTRYGLLNTAGIRVKASVVVIDSQTRLPLKNIQVSLQDQHSQTNKQGQVFFEKLKLGKSQLAITKRGYADNRQDITLGLGSNPRGNQEIVATGEQFTFILVDWLSNNRLSDAEATAGENSSNSDEDGKIILTVAQDAIGEDAVIITADGYRDEIIEPENLNDADIEVVMVPDTRHAFVSNRDNKFDVYSIDLDGSNEKLLINATEKEREVPGIVQHPTENTFALISSRDGVENSDKYILDGLFIVDAESGEMESLGRSERIQLLGWSGDLLVYTQVVEGTSRGNAERSKIFSYNKNSAEKVELAAANYFNDIELVGDTVTYAVSSFAVAQSRAILFAVKVNGDDKKEIIGSQVYTIFRTSQNSLLYNAIDQKWFSQEIGREAVEVDPVQSPKSYKYSASPNSKKVAWTDTRDGKGVLFVSDSNGENEQEIATIAGLDSVEYWATNETIVYRIIKSEETADYILHIDVPDDQRKISDVTASKRIYF